MPLPSTGPIKLSDIQGEFGDPNPISLSEYYAGGANVQAGTTGDEGPIPASGEIELSDFRGASAGAQTEYGLDFIAGVNATTDTAIPEERGVLTGSYTDTNRQAGSWVNPTTTPLGSSPLNSYTKGVASETFTDLYAEYNWSLYSVMSIDLEVANLELLGTVTAVDTDEHGRIFAASNNTGLYYSTNGGTSYILRTTANGLPNNDVNGVHAFKSSSSASTVYAATSAGFSYSTDTTNSWTNRFVADGLPSDFCRDVNRSSNGDIWVATNAGLARSTNGGVSFSAIAGVSGVDCQHICITENDNIYVATSNGIYFSTNGGSSWTNKTTADGLSSNACTGIASDGANGIFVATNSAGASISTDGGLTWGTRGGPGTNLIPNNNCQRIEYHNGIVYLSTNGGLAVSCDTDRLIWKSYYSGTTSTGHNIGPVQYDVSINPVTNKLFIASGGGLADTKGVFEIGLANNDLLTGAFDLHKHIFKSITLSGPEIPSITLYANKANNIIAADGANPYAVYYQWDVPYELRFGDTLTYSINIKLNHDIYREQQRITDFSVSAEDAYSDCILTADAKHMVVGHYSIASNNAQGVTLYKRDENTNFFYEERILDAHNSVSDNAGHGVGISDDGQTIAWGAPEYTGGLIGQGRLFIEDPDGNRTTFTGSASDDALGTVIVVSGDGNTVIAHSDTNQFTHFRRLNNYSADGYSQAGKFIAGDVEAGALLGESVDMSSDGSVLIASARLDDSNGVANSNTGAAYVYTLINGSYVEQKLLPDTFVSNSDFAKSVAVSGDGTTIAVGWQDDAAGDGSVYVYSFNGTTWIKDDTLTSTLTTGLGTDLSLSYTGDMLIGGTGENISNGRFVIFERAAGVWSETQSVPASGVTINARWGERVDVDDSGTFIVIGAHAHDQGGNNAAGVVKVFEHNGSSWVEIDELISPNVAAQNEFGRGLAISGDGSAIVVGEPGYSGGLGRAHLYTKGTGSSWTFTQSFSASDGTFGNSLEQFGESVDISYDGTVISVGSPFRDRTGAFTSGAVYTYRYNGSSWVETISTSPDITASDRLGWSIACDRTGSLVLAGTPYGEPGGNSLAGELYLFGAAFDPQQIQKITDPIPTVGGIFGDKLAISGNGRYAIVGEPGSNKAHIFLLSDLTGWQYMQTVEDLTGARFGEAVDINYDGTVVIVGDPEFNSFQGKVHIYKTDQNYSTIPTEIYVKVGAHTLARFGFSVAINDKGDRAIIGSATYNDGARTGAGGVWFEEYEGNDWNTSVVVSGAVSGAERFGDSVDISGDGNYAIVGATNWAGGNGASYFLSRAIDGTWSVDQSISPSGIGSGDNHGWACAISSDGSKAVATSRYDNGIGSAHIFERAGATWSESYYINPADGVANDDFGTSVDMSSLGTRVIIGSPLNDTTGSQRGVAYIYENYGSVWNQIAKYQPNDIVDGDLFGSDVAISSNGSLVLAGSAQADAGGSNAGAAYFHSVDGYEWFNIEEITLPASGQNAPQDAYSISYDGSVLLINEFAKVHIYVRNGSTYTFAQTINTHSTVEAEVDRNGEFIVLSDDTASSTFQVYQFNKATSTATLFQTITPSTGMSTSAEIAISPDANYIVYSDKGYDLPANNSGMILVYRKDESDGMYYEEGLYNVNSLAAPGNDQMGTNLSISNNASYIAAGSQFDHNVQIFKKMEGSVLLPDLEISTDSPNGTGEEFCHSGAMNADGDLVVVGMPGDDFNKGRIYTYTFDGTNWNLGLNQYNPEGVPTSGHRFGEEVDLSGDGQWLAASIPGRATGNGGIHIYQQSTPGNWVYNTLIAGGTGDALGSLSTGRTFKMDYTGHKMIHGAEAASSGAGKVQIRRDFTVIEEQWFGAAGEGLGAGTDISDQGSTAIFGAPGRTQSGNANAGAAHVAAYDGSTWNLVADLIPITLEVNAEQGKFVALSGDGTIAVMGGPGSSKLNIYTAGTDWSSFDTQEITMFWNPTSVTLSKNGNVLYVGVQVNDFGLTRSDFVLVYERDGSGFFHYVTLYKSNEQSSNLQFGQTIGTNYDGSKFIPGNDGTSLDAKLRIYGYK